MPKKGFHSVLKKLAPKMIAYSYVGMYCRYKWFKAFFALVAIFYLLRVSKSEINVDSLYTILSTGIGYGYEKTLLFTLKNKV